MIKAKSLGISVAVPVLEAVAVDVLAVTALVDIVIDHFHPLRLFQSSTNYFVCCLH